MIRIIRGLEGLNIVGADVVEVAPPYDGTGEQTALVAAQIGYEIITSMVGKGLADLEKDPQEAPGMKREKSEKDEL